MIGSDGKQMGIMQLKEALSLAENEGLDLVEVSPKSIPPVCRIMDYGKYKYLQAKKSQGSRKKGATQLKEIKLRPTISDHDFQFKLRHAKRFLAEGNRTKVSLLFRGREIVHPEFGKDVLERFGEEIKDLGVIEQRPKLDGKTMVMIIAPK